MGPFDFIKSINDHNDIVKNSEISIKGYNAFLTNRNFSYFRDTILYVNEMNARHQLDPILQYQFLINTLSKRKRFSKWAKPETHDDLELIKEYFGYNSEKAQEAFRVLTDDQLIAIRKKLEKGGKA